MNVTKSLKMMAAAFVAVVITAIIAILPSIGRTAYAESTDEASVENEATEELSETSTEFVETNCLYEQEDGYINYNLQTEESLTRPLLARENYVNKTICNIVIYICFSDENSLYSSMTTNPAADMLVGEESSLYDYYYDISYGKIIVNSLFPESGDAVFVYQAPGTRSSYQVLDGKAGRATKEKSLLESAVLAARDYFELEGVDLDTNKDNYVDAVSFLISGSSSSSWGSLLWPHSWNMVTIGSNVTIGGVRVGDYSFNFVNSLTLGVVCHEFFHVLGAPDLYHYDYDFVPVGDWDIMQFDADIPQYPLVHMRNKYLKVIDDSQIVQISHNGIYSLKPVTLAGETDVLAYVIPTNKPSEKIYVEYRNPNLSSGYDSSLPGSGLIVYRVKSGVEGNADSKYKSNSRADEVYVYRPNLNNTNGATSDSTRYSRSRQDVRYSYLSPNNPYFSSVGATLSEKPTIALSSRYDYSTIYYVDGTNTGIIIDALSITASSIEFRVRLNGSDNINNDFFKDKISVSSALLVNDESFSGVNVNIAMGSFDPTYIENITVKLYNAESKILATNTLALNKFQERYYDGERTFQSRFVVSDKGSVYSGVFNMGSFDMSSEPSYVEVYVTDADGDEIKLATQQIDTDTVNWETVLATQAEFTASIACGSRMTIGVKKDGTLVTGSTSTGGGDWDLSSLNNVVSVSAGLTHILALKKDLTVQAIYVVNSYGESDVEGWTDIVMISAGSYTSYGLTADGRVYATGRNNHGQLNVTSWSGIKVISAGESHVVGISKYGAIYTAGDNTFGQCNSSGITTAIYASAGNTFTAYLLNDGTVTVKGKLVGGDGYKSWTDIVAISAGTNVLLGLKSNGTVVAVGDNSYGQLNVKDLIDIEDVSAGEYHTAFLRSDGTVQIIGTGNGEYNTNAPLSNLKYDDYVYVSEIFVSASVNRLFEGETLQISAVVSSPKDATYKRLIYSTSDKSIATINANGLLTAVSEGLVTVTATAYDGSEVYGSITILVRRYIEPLGIHFLTDNQTIMINESATLSYAFDPINATSDNWNLYFTSSDTQKITVTDGGVVTALGFGDNLYVTIMLVNKDNNTVYTDKCYINVVSGIDNIVLKTAPTKNVYYYGESLDLSGATFGVIIDGNPADGVMAITSDMISGYNAYAKIGKSGSVMQTLTVTYMDKTCTFNVYLKDFVKEIEIINLPKTEFIVGESFSLGSGGLIKVTKASGITEERAIDGDESDCTEYVDTVPGYYTIYIKVVGKVSGEEVLTYSTASYQVINRDKVLSMECSLNKKSYNFGSPFDTTEQITLTMYSGATRLMEISDATITGFNSMVIGNQTITITYNEALTGNQFKVTDSIKVSFQGTIDIEGINEGSGSTNYIYYNIGEDLDLDIVATVEGRQYVVSDDKTQNIFYKVIGYQNNIPGESAVNVYIYVKNTGNVSQEIYTRQLNLYGVKKARSIVVSGVKSEYAYGEEIKAKLTVTYMDNNVDVIYLEEKDLVYDKELVGVEQVIMFKYLNEILAQTSVITIVDAVVGLLPISDIQIYYGEKPQISVILDMQMGDDIELTPEQYTTEYDVYAIGEQTVTVGYTDTLGNKYSTSFKLVVVDKMLGMSVKTPMKIQYKYGDAFDTYSVYTISWLSGAKTDIEYNDTDFRITPKPDMTKTLQQTLLITYLPLDKNFTVSIKVSNYVVGFEPTIDAKTEYNYGEQLDFDIKITYADGSQKRISVNDCTTNYNPEKAGEQEVTIAYGGGSFKITVYVHDGIKEMTWAKAPGYTTFKYGEALSLPGAELKVVYETNPTKMFKGLEILASPFVITFNPLKTGKQQVTIRLEETTITFRVTVEERSSKTLSFSTNLNMELRENYNELVSIYERTTLDVYNAFTCADYLRVNIFDANGNLLEASDETIMPGGAKITVTNNAGLEIFYYNYYLAGDGDKNGIFDENDVGYLAEYYISENSTTKSITDFDRDGSFTLTDIVKAARRATDEKLPVNALSKNFIMDIKKKEDTINE